MQEFRRALGVMGITVTSRQLSETFQAFDGDMDGTVNYAEFCERVFPDSKQKSTVQKISSIFHHGEISRKGDRSKKGGDAAAAAPDQDAEESDERQDAGAGSDEPAISVYEISQAARDASRKLQESRWTLADRFARRAPQRLDVLEENLSRIAAHLGVELLKYETPPETEVDARVKHGSRSMVKRASTSMGLRATPIGGSSI
jgi:hypothetical protein